MRLVFCVFVYFTLVVSALAADEPIYAPPGDWVIEAATPNSEALEDQTPLQLLLLARQDRFNPSSTETYIKSAYLVRTSEGLNAAGNIAIPWRPDTDELIIHDLFISRGDETIDVLANGQQFTTLRREVNLEAAMLDGVLTAAIQPEGLRVGDMVTLAYTLRSSNPVLQGHASSLIFDIKAAKINKVILRQTWPHERKMRWRLTEDLPKPKIRRNGDATEFLLELTDVDIAEFPINAPPRFYHVGQVETTDFQNWSELSRLFSPLYEASATITPGSSLMEEAEAIAAATNDPIKRTEMALRLVQDQIRYVFLGMDSGGYVPSTAERTWSRRFGDCKGKTAVLLALLHELGVKAEPVLVSTMFGDGLDARLPLVQYFDHIIIRAMIDGKEFWLDGTRIGDRALGDIITPAFKWGLPLRDAGADLLRIEQTPLQKPLTEIELIIDAAAGFDTALPLSGEMHVKNDLAMTFRPQIEALSSGDRESYLKEMWRAANTDFADLDIEDVDYTFSEADGTLTISMKGAIELAWVSSSDRRFYKVPNSSVGWDAQYLRDVTEDRTAPWLLAFPGFLEARTTILLSDIGGPTYIDGGNIDRTFHGVEFKRSATMDGGKLVMEKSIRITKNEFPVDVTDKMVEFLDEMMESELQIVSRLNVLENVLDPEKFVSTKLDSAEQFIERGVAYLDLGDNEKALEQLDRALKMDPKNAWAYANRGIARYWLNDIDEAALDLSIALSFDPDNFVAHRGEGLIALWNLKFDEAIESFTKSLDEDPLSPFALNHRAESYLMKKEFEKALDDLDSALAIDAENPHSLTLKSQLVARSGSVEEAIEMVSKAISAKPQAVMPYRVRSNFYEEIGKLELAISDLDRALELSPGDPSLWNNRCWLRATKGGDLDLALSDCEEAVRISDSEFADALDSRALVFLKKGELDQARSDYEAALSLEREMPSSLFGLGVTKLRANDMSGLSHIEAAIKLNPEIEEDYSAYGVSIPETTTNGAVELIE